METIEWIIDEKAVGERLDTFLAERCDELTRSYIQKIILESGVTINGAAKLQKNYRLRLTDTLEITIPEPIELDVLPEDIPLEVVYEDGELLVVNKPQGMVVHPAPGNYTGTLVNALLYHIKDLSSINGVIRPGIVHRIDKDTSGLLMIAKTDLAHKALAADLKAHDIDRKYIALVHGLIKKDEGIIDHPIGRNVNNRLKMAVLNYGGRRAVTRFKVITRFEKSNYTLVELTLETGRTHQIRVHLAHLHHPVVGDTVYGKEKERIKHKGQLLHAAVLGFKHPATGELLRFEAELPLYFQQILEQLK